MSEARDAGDLNGYDWADIEEDALDRELDHISRKHGSAAAARHDNARFMRRRPHVKIRKGRKDCVCETCNKTIGAGEHRMDYAPPGMRRRLRWHTTCYVPDIFQ